MVSVRGLFCSFVASLLVFGVFSVLPVPVAFATDAKDNVVRDNTKEIKGEAEGIHKDTTSIDESYKKIDDWIFKTLKYLTQSWRQGEQELRTFEDVEENHVSGSSFGDDYSVFVGKDEEGNDIFGTISSDLGSRFSSLVAGLTNGHSISYEEVLGGLRSKDSALFNQMQEAFKLYENSGRNWSGFKRVTNDKLNNELQNLLKQTKSTDVFPELSADTEILVPSKEGESGGTDPIAWWDHKFPDLPESASTESANTANIRTDERATDTVVVNEVSKTRRQAVTARLMALKEMEASKKRISALMNTLAKVEGSEQARQIQMQIETENAFQQGLKVQMDANQQQMDSSIYQAMQTVSRNSSEADRLQVALWKTLNNKPSSWETYLQETGAFQSGASISLTDDSGSGN